MLLFLGDAWADLVLLSSSADRQVQIVELDGLQLLLPLTKSKDTEVQRLAAHALANLSVNGMWYYVRRMVVDAHPFL